MCYFFETRCIVYCASMCASMVDYASYSFYVNRWLKWTFRSWDRWCLTWSLKSSSASTNAAARNRTLRNLGFRFSAVTLTEVIIYRYELGVSSSQQLLWQQGLFTAMNSWFQVLSSYSDNRDYLQLWTRGFRFSAVTLTTVIIYSYELGVSGS